MTATTELHANFRYPRFVLRKKIFTILGQKFHIRDNDGNLLFFSKKAAFKLKEDIKIFADEEMQQQILQVKARNIIDFSAIYDVTDVTTGERVGALQRRGFKSMLRDEWSILDINDQQIGKIQEDSTAMALLRRLLSNLIPQSYHFSIHEREVGRFHQTFNPFMYKGYLDVDMQGPLDPRLGVAAIVLLGAVEGRQQ